jgi:hypothetical protein
MPAQNAPAAPRPPAARRRAAAAAAAAAAAGAAVLAVSLSGLLTAGAADAAVQASCTATPSSCGYPDATTTGVPPGTTLRTVPGQVSSGPGWSYNATTGQVSVTGNGAVLTGLSFSGPVNITAWNVTMNDDQVVTGGTYGITTQHTQNVTIENSSVSGLNKTSGRVSYAIDDLYSDSAGLVIKNNNVADWRIGVNVAGGQVTGNYIHDPGYIAGDHTDGFFDNSGTLPLTISDNTILDGLSEVTAIFLASNAGQAISRKAITGNLLAGGGYAVYAGGGYSLSSQIVIQDNRFGQLYYPLSGQYGPDTLYQADGTGNTWSGNIWDTTGTTVSP